MRRCKCEKHDIARHVRSEDAPERQKTDGVHYAGDRRHSEQGVRYNLFSGWTARHKQLADRVHCDCSLPALSLKTAVLFHDRPLELVAGPQCPIIEVAAWLTLF